MLKKIKMMIRKLKYKKYSTELVNPEVFNLNFPQYINISQEEMEALVKRREEEMADRRRLEAEYGMPYAEIVKMSETDIEEYDYFLPGHDEYIDEDEN